MRTSMGTHSSSWASMMIKMVRWALDEENELLP
jgi:hypothetical protein